MSNTHKHKGKGYWNNGIEDESKSEIRKYLNHCHRHNSERGYFKPLELKKKEEIADAEMERALAEHTDESSGLHLQNVRRSALRWWNKLDKHQQNDIEREVFGEGEPWEDNTLNENDIVHMYKRHYAYRQPLSTNGISGMMESI